MRKGILITLAIVLAVVPAFAWGQKIYEPDGYHGYVLARDGHVYFCANRYDGLSIDIGFCDTPRFYYRIYGSHTVLVLEVVLVNGETEIYLVSDLVEGVRLRHHPRPHWVVYRDRSRYDQPRYNQYRREDRRPINRPVYRPQDRRSERQPVYRPTVHRQESRTQQNRSVYRPPQQRSEQHRAQHPGSDSGHRRR